MTKRYCQVIDCKSKADKKIPIEDYPYGVYVCIGHYRDHYDPGDDRL